MIFVSSLNPHAATDDVGPHDEAAGAEELSSDGIGAPSGEQITPFSRIQHQELVFMS